VILDKISSIIYSFLIITLPLIYIVHKQVHIYMVHAVATATFPLVIFLCFCMFSVSEEYSSRSAFYSCCFS
jgi:hypothetical protein